MFANRFTALLDACALVGVLKRNVLLSLAEADFYRARWSAEILDEMENALGEILNKRGLEDGATRASTARAAMERAFPDAMVDGHQALVSALTGLPDPQDAHVIAAAIKTQAAIIVTDNLSDFPLEKLRTLNLEAKATDIFIADTIALDPGRAVAAIHRMRNRFGNPEKTARQLLLDMEAQGLMETVDILRPFEASL